MPNRALLWISATEGRRRAAGDDLSSDKLSLPGTQRIRSSVFTFPFVPRYDECAHLPDWSSPGWRCCWPPPPAFRLNLTAQSPLLRGTASRGRAATMGWVLGPNSTLLEA